jgi:uncharacterized membrane protein
MRDVLRRGVRIIPGSLIALWLVAAMAVPAGAADSVNLTTAYPAVSVDPGGEATFPLRVATPEPDRVDLEVTSAPEGFETTLRGGGFIVGAVYTGSEEPPELELVVEVPDDAPPGPHEVVLRASSPPATQELTLEVTVSDRTGGSVEFTTDFPVLEGDTEATFTFDLTLTNDTAQEITFGLEAVGPAGWDVEARPAGETQAATAVVAAGSDASISVTVTPDAAAAAGSYPIDVRASGGSQSAEMQLQVDLTGITAMTLEPRDQLLNTTVTSGGSTTFALLVTNEGSAPLANVELTATPPGGWEVTFDQETIPAIEPLSQAAVNATIRPGGDAVAGDYEFPITATAGDASESLDLRTTVETSPVWGFVGLALIALVILGLFLVFRRFGRR